MLTIAGRDGIILVGSAPHIHMAQKWFPVLHSTNNDINPQWIETAALVVQNSRQPIVQ